nr:cytochrome b561/ferric reductase transmembrane [Tanacetum cinerariifolium]
MSSIDTYSTTKDLVFDEWVSSHRSNEIRIDVYFDGRFFMCPLKYEDETILDLRLPMSKRDIEKMFKVANLQRALDLYVCPIPQVCLVEYYFKNLDVVFESDEEVTSIYRGHEKVKKDASTMSFEEIVGWEKEELQSPSYLRSPHVWKINSMGIGKGKVLLDDFEIVGNGKHKVVLDDAKDGVISTKSDDDQNEGS